MKRQEEKIMQESQSVLTEEDLLNDELVKDSDDEDVSDSDGEVASKKGIKVFDRL